MPTQDFSQDFLAKAGKRGHLHLLDKIPHGDPKIGSLIAEYGKANNSNHQSRNWVRAAKWIENIMFGLGRHYIDDLLMNRIARNSSTEELSVAKGKLRNVPQPTNDILGRYLEANIALFTENRPIPRITPKSDSLVDKRGAELSELTVEYLWEELDLLEKHREIKRLNLYTGTTWLEVCYDPLQPRYIQVPETREEATTPVAPGITAPIPREVPVIDPTTGEWKLREELEYGDITAKIISGFEMHTPVCHEWNGENMGWVMRESYTSIDDLRDKYTNPKLSRIVTKRNGYFKENIDEIEPENIQELPLWWWERISDSVEGPGPTLNIGTPEQWDDHTVVRIFDRKPNPLWPKGRTIITAGDKVIYDSPKNVGARAFDTRWPKRWHPYIRYRDEAQPGSIFGRSMVSKLLPKIKRINSIDTTMIMWRRTVPIAAWILPKGSQPVEGLFSGKPASLMKYDARATLGNEPKPVYPPSYPASAMQERELQFAEIEMIAGTEDILRGERPTGTTCWTDEGYLLNENGIPVHVSDLEKYDSLMTMKGVGKIGLYHEKDYDANVIKISSYGNLPITVTPNHKIPVIPKASISRNNDGARKRDKKLRRCIDPDETTIIKKFACDIEKGDLVLSGFIRPRNIEKLNIKKLLGSRFDSQSNGVPLPEQIEITEDLLWLFGIYLAEGFIHSENKGSRNRGIGFAFNEKETNLINRTKETLSNYFGLDVKIQNVKDRSATYVHCYNRILGDLFRTLFGNKCYNKHIPEEIFQSNRTLLPLVSGWVDGDGSMERNSIRASSTSMTLAAQIRAILLDEKIYATISKTKKRVNGSFVGTHDQYHIKVYSGDVNIIARYSLRFSNDYIQTNRGRKGFWIGNLRASYVSNTEELKYKGKIYNVTMNEMLQGKDGNYCDNTVNSFGLFTCQSAAMLDTLRKQALASRSAALQSWDESIQEVGTSLLQEVIKNIKKDERYKQRINVLAREKASSFTIDQFAATNLSDNVQVRVDTASQAMVSREAKQTRAIEVMQYSQGLMMLPTTLRAEIISDLGWPDSLSPQGADINRARALIQYLKSRRFDLVVPMPEDDPYVIHEMLVDETKSEAFIDLDNDVQKAFFILVDIYRQQIEMLEMAKLQFEQTLAMGPAPPGGQGGG